MDIPIESPHPSSLQCFRELSPDSGKRTGETQSAIVAADSFIDGVRKSNAVADLLEYLAECEFGVVAETVVADVSTSVTIDLETGDISLQKTISRSISGGGALDAAVQLGIEMKCPIYSTGDTPLGGIVSITPVEVECRTPGVFGGYGSGGVSGLVGSYSFEVGLRVGTPALRPCSIEYGAGVEVLELLRRVP